MFYYILEHHDKNLLNAGYKESIVKLMRKFTCEWSLIVIFFWNFDEIECDKFKQL